MQAVRSVVLEEVIERFFPYDATQILLSKEHLNTSFYSVVGMQSKASQYNLILL